MDSEAGIEQPLPTPPGSLGEEQHRGPRPSAASSSFPSEPDGQSLGHHDSSNNSPVATPWQSERYSPDTRQDLYSYGIGADGSPYSLYGSPVQHSTPQPYHSSTPHHESAVATSTPTNSESGLGYHSLRTDGAIASHGPDQARREDSKARSTGSPRARKARKAKGDKPKMPKIDKPLSELTKDFTQVPIRNMDEWVHRPVEVRLEEVSKRNGYVTRPMNSFMLYRSAYAERTKLWCVQNNHQVVSSASGESWPLEPTQIRERYNEYARIERENHQKAHPGYKFSPSKGSSSMRKRKGTPGESDDDLLHDLDGDWRPGPERKARPRSKRLGREAGYPANSGFQNDGSYGMLPLLNSSGLHPSSYMATNPGKPLPAAIGEMDLYGRYLQTSVHPSLRGTNIEDVRMQRTMAPGHPNGGSSMLGLPGANHYELLGPNAMDPAHLMGDVQVDPSLVGYQSQGDGVFNEHSFKEFDDERLFVDQAPHRPPYGAGQMHTGAFGWEASEFKPAGHEEDFSVWMNENHGR